MTPARPQPAVAAAGVEIKVHAVLPRSRANGPGQRFVVWFQGCSLGCPACFNPRTHAPAAGRSWSVHDLAARALAEAGAIEGVSLSGGEPFEQLVSMRDFLRLLKAKSDLSVLIFSGYSASELRRLNGAAEVLAMTDILVAGRYVKTRHRTEGLLGSSNQRIHFLSRRYSAQDISALPQAEIQIDPQGRVICTGIAPPTLSGNTGIALAAEQP